MVDPEKLAQAIALLEEVARDRGVLAGLTEAQRMALLAAAGRVARPDGAARRKLAKAFRRSDREALRWHDERLLGQTGMRSARRESVFVTPDRQDAVAPVAVLERPRSCYVCKAAFRDVHHFYDALCLPCAELSYGKRFQTADLRGRVALVTGARIKIGFQVGVMLLRAGARVVVTTRFPHDAARRYAREADFAAWSDRLEIHGLDLRHAPSVEIFAEHLAERLGRLDVLVNNAAQTVRRPPAFYAHLLADEERGLGDLPALVRPLLATHHALRAALAGRAADDGPGLVRWGGARAVGLLAAARLSQLPCSADGVGGGDLAFPDGALDPDLQQVDLRPLNSWRLPAAAVPTPELIEVHLVNAIAPFILVSRLKPLMMRQRTDDKHVINVSAMEAQFTRKKKTDKHPHTNMAKAALNMLTRTSAVEYAADGIFMNSVDTGWITDEDPLVHVERKQRVHGFHPPLDIVDGAARVLDPLFVGLNSGAHPWGLFFKDYRPVDW